MHFSLSENVALVEENSRAAWWGMKRTLGPPEECTGAPWREAEALSSRPLFCICSSFQVHHHRIPFHWNPHQELVRMHEISCISQVPNSLQPKIKWSNEKRKKTKNKKQAAKKEDDDDEEKRLECNRKKNAKDEAGRIFQQIVHERERRRWEEGNYYDRNAPPKQPCNIWLQNFDTAENEPCKVCPFSVCRSSRYKALLSDATSDWKLLRNSCVRCRNAIEVS